MQVYCFPEWIVTWVEWPAILVEFVGENQNQVFTSNVTLLLVYFLRSVLVDETEIVGKLGDLASSIDPTKVKPAIERRCLLHEMGENREACWSYTPDQIFLQKYA